MSIKSDVLRVLETQRGKYFSGEQLAADLSVSRAAVWKAVKALEKEGYQIHAVTNKGYSLMPETDVLSEEGIRAFLRSEYRDIPMQVMKETSSTNLLAKQAAIEGAPNGMLFAAEHQNAGRGRRGRSFLSKPGGSICMSLLLRPDMGAVDAVFYTTAACVAVRRAIFQVTGIQTEIKWVNDLYCQGKKVCGILTEAVTSCETGIVDCIILGIGINFNMAPEEFPKELLETAGALYKGGVAESSRNELIAEITNQIFLIEKDLKERTFMEEYRKYSMLIGCQVLLLGSEEKEAQVLDIDKDGGLVVRFLDGTVNVLHTGDVTVRVRK